MSDEKATPPPKTGWPPGLLQDDHRGLSKWFANRLDAKQKVRELIQWMRRKREESI